MSVVWLYTTKGTCMYICDAAVALEDQVGDDDFASSIADVEDIYLKRKSCF